MNPNRLWKARLRMWKLQRKERWEASHGDSIFGVSWSGGSLDQRNLECMPKNPAPKLPRTGLEPVGTGGPVSKDWPHRALMELAIELEKSEGSYVYPTKETT